MKHRDRMCIERLEDPRQFSSVGCECGGGKEGSGTGRKSWLVVRETEGEGCSGMGKGDRPVLIEAIGPAAR
ncbi:hypothetical protein ZHAS_00014355 [Anopheles sinensis]|uniref:Uncharacterized protein n=1 Tax=Anopheles sinensis TaxID=74873 RepID=A0A084W820_ANOSI|nr:hypothetical protein ZHAS_00014355 [Anopheles sinensis]